jgi:hypothetical protein
LNEKADAREIADRLQKQFGEHAYKFRTVQFWIAEIAPSRQDLHDKICTGIPPLDDLDAEILALLDKSPSKSARSTIETLCIAHSTA